MPALAGIFWLFRWQESVLSIHGLTLGAAQEIKKLFSGFLVGRVVQQTRRVSRVAVLSIRERNQRYGM